MPAATDSVGQVPRSLQCAVLAVVATLVAGMGPVALAPSPVVAAPVDVHPEWGSTSAHGATIKKGCRGYAYGYTLTPPDGDWALETFLIGPGGNALSSGAMAIGMDPTTGYDKFRVCRPSTRPGVFKIRALLSVQDSSGKDYVSGWLPVTKFRLRARH